jgi:hypothetical protein
MPLTHDGVPPYGRWDYHVFLEADWDDPLPQLLDEYDDPWDLTGITLDLWVRPTWNHTTLFLHLSTGDGTIIVDNAASGLATIHVEQATMETNVPPGRWQWFLVASDGSFYKELARGDFYAHPGRE